MTRDLLSKLQGVRSGRAGNYLAQCPTHDDRSPSLSISDCGDGRILLHCFAGCETEDILAALGLTFSDIMPERRADTTPERSSYKPERTPFDPRLCLEAVAHEMACAVLICENVAEGAIVSAGLRDRLMLAAQRIDKAVALCGPPPRASDEIKKLRKGEFAS